MASSSVEQILDEASGSLFPFSAVHPLPENVAAALRERVEPGAAALRVWIYGTDRDFAPPDVIRCEVPGCMVEVEAGIARCGRHRFSRAVCAIVGCGEAPEPYSSRGLCHEHSKQVAECAEPGCGKDHFARGYCREHFSECSAEPATAELIGDARSRLDTPNYGPDRDGFECILPLTLPPSLEADEPWLRSALAAVTTARGGGLSEELRCAMAASLAPGQPRDDGLPAYEPSGPGPAESLALRGSLRRGVAGGADYDPGVGRSVFREIIEYDTRQIPLGNGREATFRAVTGRKHERRPFHLRGQGRNRGAAMRDLLAAVAHDLIGCSAFEVGTRILGGRPRDGEHDLRSSRAWPESYRAWERGRSLLAQLGCWPWVHAPGGKLPQRWRADADYLEPLREWEHRGRPGAEDRADPE